MALSKTLFPPANREAAAVAFLRTFWQVVHATGILGGGGLITISTTQLAVIDIRTVALAAGAVLLSGIVSGLFSAGDILANGLPPAYTANAVASNTGASVAVSSPSITAPVVPAPVVAVTPAPTASPSFDAVIAPDPTPPAPAPAVADPSILATIQ